jgi:hypothetical protein
MAPRDSAARGASRPFAGEAAAMEPKKPEYSRRSQFAGEEARLQPKKPVCARIRRLAGEEGDLQKNLPDSPGIWDRLQKTRQIPREDLKRSGNLEDPGKSRGILQESGLDFKKQDGFPEDSPACAAKRQILGFSLSAELSAKVALQNSAGRQPPAGFWSV